MALLEVEGLEAQYGWTKVLHGIRFAVEDGGITTILGANGAGKTTTLRAVCGMVRTAGEICRIVRAINREERVSVLLVEQNVATALDLADHAYLLETGRVVVSGPSAELRRDDAIRRSYLGY